MKKSTIKNFELLIPMDKDFNITGPTEVKEIEPIKPTGKYVKVFITHPERKKK